MKCLIERLKTNRDEYLETTNRLTDAEAGISLGPGDWTVWGLLAHLAAAEWQLRRLAEIIATRPDYGFEPFDRDELNARSVRRYEGQSVEEVLAQWKANRAQTIEFVSSLTDEQAQNRVIHPRYGMIGPRHPIERIIFHVSDHLAHLQAALEALQ